MGFFFPSSFLFVYHWNTNIDAEFFFKWGQVCEARGCALINTDMQDEKSLLLFFFLTII